MAYVNRMRDAGVRVHLMEGPQQGHGFIYSYQDTKYARSALPRINQIMAKTVPPGYWDTRKVRTNLRALSASP